MIYAGTGHRPEKIKMGDLNAYHPHVYERLVDLGSAVIRRYRPTLIISGMALGWDQALAEAAVREGVPFDAYVPHEGQERTWPAASQRKYREITARARQVVLVTSGPYAAYKMQRRNIAMTDASDRLVALWDGVPNGGTFNCVAYAQEQGRDIVNVWSNWIRYAQLDPHQARSSGGRRTRP